MDIKSLECLFSNLIPGNNVGGHAPQSGINSYANAIWYTFLAYGTREGVKEISFVEYNGVPAIKCSCGPGENTYYVDYNGNKL